MGLEQDETTRCCLGLHYKLRISCVLGGEMYLQGQRHLRWYGRNYVLLSRQRGLSLERLLVPQQALAISLLSSTVILVWKVNPMPNPSTTRYPANFASEMSGE